MILAFWQSCAAQMLLSAFFMNFLFDIQYSSHDILQVMQATFMLLIMFFIWCGSSMINYHSRMTIKH